MLESVVASILNRVLGNYVSNLNYDQLKVGIWKGEVNLKDLKLKREALDKLDLPINVSEGFLGELTLSIPWANLKTKPVKVYVNNVYLLAVPKDENTVTLQEEEERAQQLKQRRLATAELLQNTQQEQKEDGQSDGFMSQLTTKIIDNLQFSMKNIHIRYEDHFSDPGRPFAAGITLKELSAVSTDSNWKTTFISELASTIHKLVTLECLSVYWNTDSRSLAGLKHEEAAKVYADLIPNNSNTVKGHQHILNPVSGTGKVKLNKKFGSGVAKTDVTLLFNELAFALDDEQYRDAILMVDLFHANLKKHKYLKYRPRQGTTPKSHPIEYFRYAGNAILAEIHERNYRWTWAHFKKRRQERLSYVECYTAQKMQKATPEQLEILKALEWNLSFEDIRFYRSIAKSKMRREKIKIGKNETVVPYHQHLNNMKNVEEEKKLSAQSSKGWFSSWWSGTSSTKSDESDTDSFVMTEEQKKELYDAIEYDEEKALIAAAVDMPKDASTMKFNLSVKLNKGSFTIRQQPHSVQPRELASIVFDNVSMEVTQYVESMKASASLGDLRLFDGSTENTLYPQLIGVKQETNASLMRSDIQRTDIGQFAAQSETQQPFFAVKFERKPLSGVADNVISLTMRHLEIIYNPTVIMGIVDFLKPPQNKMESVQALIEVAGDTIENFRRQTRAGLEYALQTHTTILLDVDMDAPIFVIPQSCVIEDSPAMIIDAGHITIDSDLANQELANEFKVKADQQYTQEDYDKLEGLMYDKFNLHLSQMRVLIAPSVKDCLAQLHQKVDKNQDAHLIDRTDIKFLVELCILQGSNQFTKFKVSGHLPLLSVNFSNSKYKTLMKIVDLLVPSSSTEGKAVQTTDKDRNKGVLSQRLWNEPIEDLLISDTDSEMAEDSTVDNRLRNYSSDSVMSVESTQQEQFKFSFRVDKVSVLLNETSSDLPGLDVLLCTVVLENFALLFVSRPYDMSVDVSLRTLNIVDEMEHGKEFLYLVTSDIVNGEQGRPATEKNLVNVRYLQVNRKHPQFHNSYGGYDQTVDVTLSTLNIIVTRSSLLTLYNFVLETFTGAPEGGQQQQEDRAVVQSHTESALEIAVENSQKQKKQENSMKIQIHLDSLDFILNNDGKRLGTGTLSFGALTILLHPKALKVTGKFGNFALSDDTAVSSEAHDLTRSVSTVHILSIVGDELMNFNYETFDPLASNYPGYEQQFQLRMGAFKFLFLDSVKPIVSFLSEFLEMKTVYDAARRAAAETAQQLQETSARFHFDVAIKSPVVIFPVGDGKDKESIVAYLGEIRAINQFVDVVRRSADLSQSISVPVNAIQCGLHSIRLQSISVRTDDTDVETEKYLSILNDLDVTFELETAEHPEDVAGPISRITGNVSDVRMSLTERQYKSIMEVSNLLSASFGAATDDVSHNQDDEGQNLSETSSVISTESNSMSGLDKQISKPDKEKEGDSGRIQMDLLVNVKNICLEILTGSEGNESPLSSLSFYNTSLKMQTMMDSSMIMEMQLQSMSFADTRWNSTSLFKEIMPATHLNGPQLQIRLTTHTQDGQSTTQVAVTVDSPKIVLSLDYLLLLKEFFASPFVPEQRETEAQKYARSQREKRDTSNVAATQEAMAPSTAQATASRLRYHINVVDVEVICLARPELSSSEATIFLLKKFSVQQEKDLEIAFDGIGMVLCRMDNRKESAMRVLEEFSMKMTMTTSSTPPGHSTTVIKLHVQPIILRVSYHDAMLIMEIVNKTTQLLGSVKNGNEPKLPPIPEASEAMSSTIQASSSPVNGSSTSRSTSHKIEPYIVMTKESLTADVQFLLSVNNYNFLNSHWEPIIEPWRFGVNVSQNPADKSMNITVESGEQLYVNVTHTFLESLLSISETLKEVQASGMIVTPLPESAQNRKKPYLIRNCTGYNLRFWNMSDDVESGDTSIYHLRDGEEQEWTFRDWKKRRELTNVGKNLVGVQVEQFGWESLLHIPLDQEGQQVYRMQPEVNAISHRLVVDIRLENHIKTVTFRSGFVVKNQCKRSIQMTLVDTTRKIMSDIWTFEPEQEHALPIDKAFHYWVTVRPSDEYRWSNQLLHWSDIIHPKGPKAVVCERQQDGAGFIFQLDGIFDRTNPLVRQYPCLTLQLGAPMQVENLLPVDFTATLMDKLTGQGISAFIKKGEIMDIHTIPSHSPVELAVELHEDKYEKSPNATISTTANYSSIAQPLVLPGKNGGALTLRMNVARLSRSSDALWISIFVPYLTVNKTGIPVSLKAYTSRWQSKAPVETLNPCTEGTQVKPVMFSYPEVDHRNRAQIALPESRWSEALSFEAVGSSRDVTLMASNNSNTVHLGVQVEEGIGQYRLTKLVTIAPRFIMKNNTKYDMTLRELAATNEFHLDANQKYPVYEFNKSPIKWLCLRLRQVNDVWSAPFDIQEIGATHVKLDKGDSSRPLLVKVTVLLQNSSIFIFMDEAEVWPYRIVNNSTVEVKLFQEDNVREEYSLEDKQKAALSKPKIFLINPGTSLDYSWDMPVTKEKRLIIEVFGRKRTINMQAIGTQLPFRYRKLQPHQDGSEAMSIDVVAHNSSLVLVLSDFDPLRSVYQPTSSGASTLTSKDGSVRDHFEAVDVKEIITFTLDLRMSGIGVSVINKHIQEMALATIKGLDLKYKDSNLYQSIRLNIQWLQIDNQLHGSTYPILFFPTTLPKQAKELETHPTLHISLDKVKDDFHGVNYFKFFSILLQEMTFEMDEDFLYEIMEFSQFSVYKEQPADDTVYFAKDVDDPTSQEAPAMYFFEAFCIQPMRLNISFVRTERLKAEDSAADSRGSPFSYVFNVFTMTLGNINDAPIKLNALIVDNLYASYDDLLSRMMLHYKDQVVYQLHKVLGSADVIGNPVGLFNNLSSGFGELFYEPYQGFIMSDRPQDLGIGIARGVGGFMKKSVFGVTDSVSRITGSLGKGLSAATMDKKFQERRRLNLTRNKPRHAMYGVTQGVAYFGTSVASGVAGLVKRPMEGAKSGGALGFVDGVGRGLVGVLTKPVVGVFDLASNVSAGIRETTTIFDSGDIGRERLPRYIGADGILTPFSQREALGQMWLKQVEGGKYFNESYIAHCVTVSDETVALLTYQSILSIQTRKLTIEWEQPLDDVVSCEADRKEIIIHCRTSRPKALLILESTSRQWFLDQIQNTIARRQEDLERQ
ncbi:hypothetical protein EC973_005477 [Apophysomyces ossiformis]|uniref:Vacuolar protein sorting-associated protein n=1 Tax=Apophysomyces ossiformis TaxID=679940 RepID=A0A8H7BWF8_9FUNG|nr:hypothetical protein EC973_005477 [Apophysomyces ossiformis]